jgi:hypothetical protein
VAYCGLSGRVLIISKTSISGFFKKKAFGRKVYPYRHRESLF